MNRGRNAFLITMSVVTAACTASTGGLAIRAMPDPAARLRGSGSLNEARGQLALGNAGLALEGFRKALRTDGDSADAFSGIAACYAAMGRFDLARSNYEAALALDPRNPGLLRALASVLDTLGKSTEAADARADAAASAAAAAYPTAVASSVTVKLPPARPATPSHEQAQGLPSSALPPLDAARQAPSTLTVGLSPAPPASALGARTSALGRTSPARVERGGGRSATAASSPAPAPVQRGPRLERLSPGEVALLTTGAPTWKAQVVSRTRASTTVRWVPVQTASARPNIRVLNAARSAGLAARSRQMLLSRGWRKIEIGDAPAAAHRTVVIYPAGRAALGRSLAAQFNCASRKSNEGDVLLVLIGRDRAGPNALKG